MIVLQIPADGSSATMISFPRDSWVPIPGHGTFKLNSAYADGAANGGGNAGGMRLLITTIENMASQALTAAGFQVGPPSDTARTSTTTVEYPAGMEAQAKAVADAVPGSTAVVSGSVGAVTLVLGTDGHTAGGTGAPTTHATTPSAPASTPTVGNAYGKTGTCIN